jgi:hypothetical protein
VDLADWHRWWKDTGAREMRALLMERWDPIGVSGFPEAADEYDTYGGHVARMLREGTASGAIAAYLADIRANRIGLGSPQISRNEADVAARLIQWYDEAMRAR